MCSDTNIAPNLPTTMRIPYANYAVGHRVPTKQFIYVQHVTAPGTSRFPHGQRASGHHVPTTHLRATCRTPLGSSCFLLEHRASLHCAVLRITKCIPLEYASAPQNQNAHVL
jgi:hypothetical protein